MYPGQYPQPNPRRTNVDCSMISGYATARLYAPILATAVDPPLSLLGVQATVLNKGTSTVKMSFVPLDSRTIPVLSGSGTRCALYDQAGASVGNYLYVSGGGQVTVSFRTNKQVLEVFADEGGPSQVRVTLDSLIQWDHQGFDKLDAKYPPQLTQPKWSSFPLPSNI